jgi:hypothetical protein
MIGLDDVGGVSSEGGGTIRCSLLLLLIIGWELISFVPNTIFCVLKCGKINNNFKIKFRQYYYYYYYCALQLIIFIIIIIIIIVPSSLLLSNQKHTPQGGSERT